MQLNPGSTLGPYRIVSSLGAGGMGEVYRAHDAKLHRDVAIKVLASLLAADPDRVSRFEREAYPPQWRSAHRPHLRAQKKLARWRRHGARRGEDLARRIARGRFRR
jgi:serine/threonine protein kinase